MPFLTVPDPPTTDPWETTHSQAMTGEWDNGKTLFKDASFINPIRAEAIADMNGHKEFDTTLLAISMKVNTW